MRDAGYCLFPAAMLHPDLQVQKIIQEAAAVYSTRHPTKPEGQIVHAFLEVLDRGMRWLILQLEAIIPKVSDPVLRGMLLLTHCQMQPLPDEELPQFTVPDQPDLPVDVAQWQGELCASGMAANVHLTPAVCASCTAYGCALPLTLRLWQLVARWAFCKV
jgi:hypothetical protein